MKRYIVGTFLLAMMAWGTHSQAQDIEPRFPGCADPLDLDCAEMKMLQFVFSNLQHPESAKTAGVTGNVIAKFTVTAKGEVKNPSIVTGLGHGCDEEVIRILSMMPPWLPGEEAGAPKDMEYEISVKFK